MSELGKGIWKVNFYFMFGYVVGVLTLFLLLCIFGRLK